MSATDINPSEAIAQTGLVLRITTAAGALVLVHNVYGQAAPASRAHIRFAMLGLAAIWIYDLNLYTVAYLNRTAAIHLFEWRGFAMVLAAPLRALAARNDASWRVRPSRAATFQSLSLLAICAYFALMAILGTALRGVAVQWSSSLEMILLGTMTVAGLVLLDPRPRRLQHRMPGFRSPHRPVNHQATDAPEVTVVVDRVRKNTRTGSYELRIAKVLRVKHWNRRTGQPA